jgi:hypothetical protein
MVRRVCGILSFQVVPDAAMPMPRQERIEAGSQETGGSHST